MIHVNKGKVYGGAVNNKRKRYAKDLKAKKAHNKDLNVIVDQNTGVPAELRDTELSFRAGYNKACEESAAAAKTSAGLKANERVPVGVKIKNVAVNAETGKALTSKQILDAYGKK